MTKTKFMGLRFADGNYAECTTSSFLQLSFIWSDRTVNHAFCIWLHERRAHVLLMAGNSRWRGVENIRRNLLLREQGIFKKNKLSLLHSKMTGLIFWTPYFSFTLLSPIDRLPNNPINNLVKLFMIFWCF